MESTLESESLIGGSRKPVQSRPVLSCLGNPSNWISSYFNWFSHYLLLLLLLSTVLGSPRIVSPFLLAHYRLESPRSAAWHSSRRLVGRLFERLSDGNSETPPVGSG